MNGIELSPERTQYRPGETIRIALRWELATAPRSLLLNLLWYTRGKGDEDIRVVTGETITDPGASGQREFSFEAPAHPPSFSGKLITLSWALEALTEPDSEVARAEIVIAPLASEVQLPDPDAAG